ncbi:disulfide bond formation protein DsbB [Domibacillus enclensis]|uniref:Probable disulfide formation protein n=1 Tax=Domibacillus enclensis TaxID=1017273 RepID=A0A1N6XR46_9BACI|nr:disulfide bond formation protein DsbB [Domibacillus enclensis]
MLNKTLLAAWLTAITATLGSLFFSDQLGFVPCTMCWYQRILMYPLTLVLGLAFYWNDSRIYRYVLPLSAIGMGISGYHYALQKVPAMKQFEMCTSGVPCSGEYINVLSFITIPFLSFTAFTIITICMSRLRKTSASS